MADDCSSDQPDLPTNSQMESATPKQEPTVVDDGVVGVDTVVPEQGLPKQSTDQIEVAPVKEEEGFGRSLSSSCSGKQMDLNQCMRDPRIAGFVKKLLKMVEDPKTDSIISWTHTRDSFVLKDPHEFSKRILPLYFKHNNVSSFIHQLNNYGFRKNDCDRSEYANPGFQQGKMHLLKNIKRKLNKADTKNDKDTVNSDFTKLREQQEYIMDRISAIEECLRLVECSQQRILLFLSEASSNPDLVQQLMGMTKKRKVVEQVEGHLEKKGKLLAEQNSRSLPKLVETSQGADCKNHFDEELPTWPSMVEMLENEHLIAKDDSTEGFSDKLSKIFVEFEDLVTKPSELEARIQSLLP